MSLKHFAYRHHLHAQGDLDMNKKILPAVFAQKKINGASMGARAPKLLELFEADLVKVTGGKSAADGSGTRTDTACLSVELQMSIFDDCKD